MSALEVYARCNMKPKEPEAEYRTFSFLLILVIWSLHKKIYPSLVVFAPSSPPRLLEARTRMCALSSAVSCSPFFAYRTYSNSKSILCLGKGARRSRKLFLQVIPKLHMNGKSSILVSQNRAGTTTFESSYGQMLCVIIDETRSKSPCQPKRESAVAYLLWAMS